MRGGVVQKTRRRSEWRVGMSDTSGYFPIADADSIKLTDKRARKVYDEYIKAAQALDGEYYPDTPTGPKKPSLCDTGPVPPRA